MKKLIVGNWKLNPQKLSEARVLVSRIEHGMMFVERKKLETVLCPPFVFLPSVRTAVHLTKLGAQSVSHEAKGAFTGEVSASQLKDFGVQYVIVGHSERRALGEDDSLISQKIEICLSAGIIPILCVGFGTKKSHSTGTIKRMIMAQLKKGMERVKKKDYNKVVIAYEPVWAISHGLGTGTAATPKHALEIINYIEERFDDVIVIYGGSIDAKNSSHFAEAGISGGLVGGASLNAEEFLGIIKTFSKSKN